MSIIYIDNEEIGRARKQQLIQEDDNTCFVIDLWGCAGFVVVEVDLLYAILPKHLNHYSFKDTPLIEETEDNYTIIRLTNDHTGSEAILLVSAYGDGEYYSASYATGTSKDKESIFT